MFTYSSGRNIAEWTSASQGTAKQEFFCNVIQHHNLEDQLTNLQQKLFQFQLAEVRVTTMINSDPEILLAL